MTGGWRTTWIVGITLLGGAAVTSDASAQEQELRIELVNGSEREARAANELRALLERYPVEPWIFTREVRVEQGVIPHSHPVLTLSTAALGQDDELMAMFVHEQLHWLEDVWGERWQRAVAELETMYPDVPTSAEGGARDRESTYRHLVVCHLEYQALTTLLGEERARAVLEGQGHYQWIYDRILNDAAVGELVLRHGLDARRGAPRPPS